MSKITAKGQTTLPAEIRAALGVGPGDRVRYVRDPDGRIVIEKDERSFASLRGILKPGRPVSLGEIDAAIDEARTEVARRRAGA